MFLLFAFFILSASAFSQNPAIDSLQNILKTAKEDSNKIDVLNNLTRQFINTGDYTKALQYALDALVITHNNEEAPSLSIKNGVAAAHVNIGIINYIQSNYPEALKNYFMALKKYEESGNKKGMAASYSNIGIVFCNQGNYSDALENYFSSLKIDEELNDKQGIAASYNNIGIIYSNMGNYPEALKNYSASLKIKEKIGDKQGIAASYNAIGNIFLEQVNYPEALKNYFSALKIQEQLGDKPGIAVSYNNIGIVYKEQGNYNEAFKNNFASLKIKKEMGDKYGIVYSYINLGELNIKSAAASGISTDRNPKITSAERYLNDALLLSKEIGSKEEIKASYMGLSVLDSLRENYKAAFEHYKMYVIYRDSLINEETAKKTLQSALTFEFDKKQAEMQAEHDKKEIVLQNEKNKKTSAYILLCLLTILSAAVILFLLQKRKTEKLLILQEKTDTEKKKFEMEVKWFNAELKALRSQMNPHFIFNCMTSIQSFMTQNDSASAAKFLSKFARLIRATLENSEQAFISLESELKMLENYMELEKMRFGKKITYSVSMNENIFPESLEIPSMLIQPFVENAIIHGITPRSDNNGKIEITFKIAGNFLLCEITDNGIGRKKSGILKEQMDIKHKSMGMSIIQERLELINAREKAGVNVIITDLQDEFNTPNGTKVEINIPLRERKSKIIKT